MRYVIASICYGCHGNLGKAYPCLEKYGLKTEQTTVSHRNMKPDSSGKVNVNYITETRTYSTIEINSLEDLHQLIKDLRCAVVVDDSAIIYHGLNNIPSITIED